MNTIQIIIFIFGILFIVGGIINVFIYITGQGKISPDHMAKGAFLIIGGGIMAFTAMVFLPKMMDEYTKRKEITEAHKNQAVSEYTFYLDGEKVDPKTINLDAYEWSYNDSDKIVTLTKSNPTTIILCAVVVLIFAFSVMVSCLGGRRY